MIDSRFGRLALSVVIAVAAAASAGCTQAGEEAETGTDALRTARKARSCHVVDVTSVNNDVFEEGLASVYDVSDDGHPQFDGDSITVTAEPVTGGFEVGIGQQSFSSAEGDEVTAGRAGDPLYTLYTVKPKDGPEQFELRIFENELGVVLHRATASARLQLLATVDCRTGFKPPAFEE